MSNISVTGNEAQFNENVTFLKDVDIRGSLIVPEINSSSLSITGIATFTSQVTFNQGLSFPDLEVRDFLKVGIGGTVLSANSLLNPGKVGIGITNPTELLDVFGKAKIKDLELETLLVTGISTLTGITTQKSTLFTKQLSSAGVSTFFNTINVKTAGGSEIGDASGSLDIRSNVITLTNQSDNQNYAVFTNNAGVELLYANYKKFETSSNGVISSGDLVVNDVGIRTSGVGLGTDVIKPVPFDADEFNDNTQGSLRLVVDGSVSISRNIYDSAGTPGEPNYFLKRTGTGIRWTQIAPGQGDGIEIENEGQSVPVTGAAQTFTSINFAQENSFGIGVDNVTATAAAVPGTGLATVFTSDFWGVEEGHVGVDTGIYRMTNVGIGSSAPSVKLDVSGDTKLKGNFSVTGITTLGGLSTVTGPTLFTKQLSVSDISTFDGNIDANGDLDVDGTTDLDVLNVSETATFDGNIDANQDLDVDGRTELDITNISETLNVTGISTFGSEVGINSNLNVQDNLDVDGRTELDTTNISETLRVGGISTFVGVSTFNNQIFTNKISNSGIITSNMIHLTGGSFTAPHPSGETRSDSAIIVNENFGIYSLEVAGGGNDNRYLRSVIQKDSDVISIGQTNTALISGINIIPGNLGTVSIGYSGAVSLVGVSQDGTTANIEKLRTVGSGITVFGNLESQTLNITGLSTFGSAVDINDNLDVDGITELDITNISETLNVTGLSTFNDNVRLIDDKQLIFGTSDGLEIYHSGDSYIRAETGHLYIQQTNTDKDIKIQGTNGTEGIIVEGGGSYNVKLHSSGNLKLETNDSGIDITGHTETDTLKVSGLSTFKSAVDIDADLDVDGHTELDNVNVSGFSTFSNAVDFDSTIKDRNDDVGTTVAENLSNNITNAFYNATTGITTIFIANHNFANGDSIKIPDGTLTFQCDYKGVTGSQSYPRSKDPNSGKWLVISNVQTNQFEVNLGDGGVSAGVAHTFVSGGGVIHSSGLYVKDDYRLASVGTGVSWRPSGVQTKRTIWVSKSGSDNNSGLLEGDAKATVGAAASIAVETDTIKIRPGVYEEDNPIGLRTDVSVTGEDLRLVIIKPKNKNKDVFHVRRGCLVENLNFGGSNVGVGYDGSACVAFPPPSGAGHGAVSGYKDPGPATEGPSGRWRSPYVRNCTNFMTSSIGMKIDGDHATASTIGADLKSMVCDSFTQYNENGIGVSLTNDAYAQLVSIFTINCDIGIFAGSGAQCDLTNSNSSFGNFGLVAVGLGSTQFTGIVSNTNTANELITSTAADSQDTVVCANVKDDSDGNNTMPFTGAVRRPFDGQALYFKIDLDNYPDTVGSGRITSPLQQLRSINLIEGADTSGYSAFDPPSVLIRDADGELEPKGPQGIIAEATATISPTGNITAISVVAQGRNYLPTQNIVVDIEGETGIATAVMEPIYFTVESATQTENPSGITTITFNEFVPYELFPDDPFTLQRISRVLTSSHSFEYVGTGTDINIATPLQGAIPIKENEIVAKDGAQIPFTSTDQKGNFDIGSGLQINQTTSTISGRDFSRSLQAEVTPLILALR